MHSQQAEEQCQQQAKQRVATGDTAKDFSKIETELVTVVDALQRAISIIEKEMTKNPTPKQKDTEHSVKSVDDEAYHRADLDDNRRCSQPC